MGLSVFPSPSSSPLPTRFTSFTSSGTFIHPDGYSSPRLVYVVAMGGGGGGGSGGVRGANATGTSASANGGAGGGSGLVFAGYYYVTANTTVTIGAGGIGGTSVSDASTGLAGNSGNDGGITYFGVLAAKGGGGGGGGYTNSQNTYPYALGGSGSNVGAYNAASPAKTGTAPEVGNTGGTNGDGYYFAPSGSTSRYGALGANGGLYTSIGGTSVNSPILNVVPTTLGYLSGGGGSGASVYSNTVSGTANGGTGGVGLYNGGNGGLGRIVVGGASTADNGTTPSGYGGGGGGGGAALSTTTTATSGSGGNGAPGYLMVWY